MGERWGSGEDPLGGPEPHPGPPDAVEGRPEEDLAVEEGPSVPCRAQAVEPTWTRFRARLRRFVADARALWVHVRPARAPRPPYRQP